MTGDVVVAQCAQDAVEQRRRRPLQPSAHAQQYFAARFTLEFDCQAFHAHERTLPGYTEVTGCPGGFHALATNSARDLQPSRLVP